MEMILCVISFAIGLFICSKFNVIGFGSDAREAIGNGCGTFLGLWLFSSGIVYAIYLISSYKGMLCIIYY